jgi:hypothetical protein
MTLGQIAAVEDATGIGMSDWPTSPKRALLYAHIYAQMKGVTLESAMQQKLRDIDLSGDDEQDPTAASD